MPRAARSRMNVRFLRASSGARPMGRPWTRKDISGIAGSLADVSFASRPMERLIASSKCRYRTLRPARLAEPIARRFTSPRRRPRPPRETDWLAGCMRFRRKSSARLRIRSAHSGVGLGFRCRKKLLTAEFAETCRRERGGEHPCEAVDRSLLLHFFLQQGEAGGRAGGRASLRTLCRRAAYLEHRTVRENSTAPIRSADRRARSRCRRTTLGLLSGARARSNPFRRSEWHPREFAPWRERSCQLGTVGGESLAVLDGPGRHGFIAR